MNPIDAKILERMPGGKGGATCETISQLTRIPLTVCENRLRRLVGDGKISREGGIYRKREHEPAPRAIPASPATMTQIRLADASAIAAAPVDRAAGGGRRGALMPLDQLQAEVAAVHEILPSGRVAPLPPQLRRQVDAHGLRRCARCPALKNLHPPASFVTDRGSEVPYCASCWRRYQSQYKKPAKATKAQVRARILAEPDVDVEAGAPMQPEPPSMQPPAPDMQPPAPDMQPQAGSMQQLQRAIADAEAWANAGIRILVGIREAIRGLTP